MRGRFAPSPTGELHVGSASTALLAWLQARGARGTLVLRVEDLDRPRAVPGMAAAQLSALAALGLDWDEGPDIGGPFGPYRQSERGPLYEAALNHLESKGRLYRCYCSRAELSRSAAPGGDEEEGPAYPGTCRELSSAECEARESAGRAPAYRFRVRPGRMTFHDDVFGEIAQDVAREVGDFIVKRRDGIVAYQLAVVVDDIAMRIDHVLRGADLLRSTPRQLQLYEALGAEPPAFAHVPLWLGGDGAKLSKRHGKIGIQTRLLAGETPARLLSEIAVGLGLGTSVERPADLLSGFDVRSLSPEPRAWNAK